jgi:hypothetical protein
MVRGDIEERSFMKSSAPALAAVLALAVSGCSLFGGGRDADSTLAAPAAWRDIATPADRDRVARWRTAWTEALAKAERSGHGPEIAAHGALMQPDAALDDPVPPPGEYRCSVIKLGSQGEGGLDYVSYPPFTCRIGTGQGVLSFTKLDGSQRPVGRLFSNDDRRMIFLGTMALGDERGALDYGADAERDMAGALERIGPRRWRLVLPWPRWESTLDVIELVPKAG